MSRRAVASKARIYPRNSHPRNRAGMNMRAGYRV